MAASSYDRCLARLLAHEGGYTNHPSDPGGPTNFGITIYDYRKYVKPNATAADVRLMKLDEAKAIYRTKYWAAQRCDDLPASTKRIKSTKVKTRFTNRALISLSLKTDPIFAAINEHRKLLKECDRLFATIDRAESTPKKQNQRRISSLRRQYERTLRAERAAGMRMAKMKPKTLAGAAALLAYTRADMKLGIGPKWHMVALATIAVALAGMDTA